jgi:hypothetical protein
MTATGCAAGARGRRTDQPRHDRRPRPRHPGGRQVAGACQPCRARRCHHRRWRFGRGHFRPPADVEAAYAEKVRFRARRQAQYRRLRSKPSVTLDGHPVDLQMNAGLLVDCRISKSRPLPASGCSAPNCSSWSPRVPAAERPGGDLPPGARRCARRPVTFRSLDIGGDKVLPYLGPIEEENPAMGWRAIRLGLDRPGCCAPRSARCCTPPPGASCA